MKPARLLLVSTLVALLWPHCRANADYYTYTDRNGVACMTNDRNAVPARFRRTMKVVREEKPAPKESGAPAQQLKPVPATPTPTAAPPSQPDQQQTAATEETRREPSLRFWYSRFPWLKPLLLVLGASAALLLLTRLVALLPSPQMARVIYLAFFLGVFVFAYKLYADHLVTGYFSAKNRILRMFTDTLARQSRETGEPSNPSAGPHYPGGNSDP